MGNMKSSTKIVFLIIALPVSILIMMSAIADPVIDIDDSNIFDEDSNICTANKDKLNAVIFPCNVSVMGAKDIVQYVNLTWTGKHDEYTSWVFIYDQPLKDYRIYQRIYTHKPNETVAETYRYWHDITDNVQMIGTNKLDRGWIYYNIKNELMYPNKTYELMWVYTPYNLDKQGTWRVLTKNPSKTVRKAVQDKKYMFIDPWWKAVSNDTSTVILYRLDNATSTVVRDETGRYNGTLSDVKYWTTDSKFGNSAVNFTGSGYISVPGGFRNLPSGTVELWVNLKSYMGDVQNIIYKETGIAATISVMGINTDGTFYGSHDNSITKVTSVNRIPFDAWTHIAWTWNGSHQMVHIDGVQNNIITSTDGVVNDGDTWVRISELGNNAWDMNATIDEFRISNVARNYTSIKILRPLNISHETMKIHFNITARINLSIAYVELNGTNHTMTNQSGEWQYTNDTLNSGSQQAIFWANTSSDGNWLKNTRWFSVSAYIDVTPPNASMNSTSSKFAGTSVSHNLMWEDWNKTLKNNMSGYIFSFCNGTWNGTNCNIMPDYYNNVTLYYNMTNVLTLERHSESAGADNDSIYGTGGYHIKRFNKTGYALLQTSNQARHNGTNADQLNGLEIWNNGTEDLLHFGASNADGFDSYIKIYRTENLAYVGERELKQYTLGSPEWGTEGCSHNGSMWFCSYYSSGEWGSEGGQCQGLQGDFCLMGYNNTWNFTRTYPIPTNTGGAGGGVNWIGDYLYLAKGKSSACPAGTKSKFDILEFNATKTGFLYVDTICLDWDASNDDFGKDLVNEEIWIAGYPGGSDDIYRANISSKITEGWVNDTWVEFTGTPFSGWSNVTKTTNSTVGAVIAWKIYANDTSGNWNVSSTYTYTTISSGVADTTPPKINIFEPTNKSYYNSSITLNWTTNENLNFAEYSLNNGKNITLLDAYTGINYDVNVMPEDEYHTRGLHVNGSGIWVTFYDYGSSPYESKVRQYHLNGTYANFEVNLSLDYITDISMNGSNIFYTSHTASGLIAKYDMQGNLIDSKTNGGVIGYGYGIANNGTDVFTIDMLYNRVDILDLNLDNARAAFSLNIKNGNPLGMTIENNYIYIGDNTDKCIYNYSITGAFHGKVFNATNNTLIYGVAINASYFFVSEDTINDRIHVYLRNNIVTNTTINATVGTNSIKIWINDTSGNMNSSTIWFTYKNFSTTTVNTTAAGWTNYTYSATGKTSELFNITVVNRGQSLNILNLSVTNKTGTADGFGLNTTNFSVTWTPNRVHTLNNNSNVLINITSNSATLNTTFYGNITLTMEDGSILNITVQATYSSAGSGNANIKTPSSISISIDTSQTSPHILYLNNTGNYNLTACNLSLSSTTGTGTFNISNFTISNVTTIVSLFTFTPGAAGSDAGANIFLRCVANVLGGIDTDNIPVSIAVSESGGTSGTSPGGGGGIIDILLPPLGLQPGLLAENWFFTSRLFGPLTAFHLMMLAGLFSIPSYRKLKKRPLSRNDKLLMVMLTIIILVAIGSTSLQAISELEVF